MEVEEFVKATIENAIKNGMFILLVASDGESEMTSTTQRTNSPEQGIFMVLAIIKMMMIELVRHGIFESEEMAKELWIRMLNQVSMDDLMMSEKILVDMLGPGFENMN